MLKSVDSFVSLQRDLEKDIYSSYDTPKAVHTVLNLINVSVVAGNMLRFRRQLLPMPKGKIPSRNAMQVSCVEQLEQQSRSFRDSNFSSPVPKLLLFGL